TPWYYKYLDEPSPNAPKPDATTQLIADLSARLDKAEARADAAEANVRPDAPSKPSPAVATLKKSGKNSSKK
ncbi:hypothetical protein LCGC14_3120490, partial [marine sediment metagenome]